MNEQTSVFLVGVDHRIQYLNAACGPEWRGDIQQFTDYLVDQARSRKVDLLAEEFTHELVLANQARASTVQVAAELLGVRHCFCDPDSRERERSQIERPDQREAYWLERLRDSGCRCILFVCGNEHVASFANLTRENGFTAETLSQGWGIGWQLKN